MSQEENNQKPDAGKILIEELNATPPSDLPLRRRIWQIIQVPILAILTGLIIGAIILVASSEVVWEAWSRSPGEGLLAMVTEVARGYGALFAGAIGNPVQIINALQSGEADLIRRAFRPFFDSLVVSTPFIFAGLAVAFGFRAGLFNIGAEGQLFIGAVCTVWVGYSIQGLPAIIHIPLALLAGFAGGAAWGFIPGWLKARTGAHEVINTIMMNFIAFRLTDWLLRGPMQRPDSFNPISPTIADSAKLPKFFADPIRFHMGFFIALGFAYLVYWYLFKSKWGFDLRSVGANPNASRYAGMSIVVVTVLAMSLSGGLAGLAGTNEVLGLNYNLAQAFSSGYGFDSIAVALLGKSHPVGVVLSALLFGFLRNGATRMQIAAQIPVDIIGILQALILAFIATPAIIRTIYRLKAPSYSEEGFFVRSWGGD